MSGPLEVIVVGGGIGGLTAALCLARRGSRVTVVEQSQQLEEVGAGIQLSPNCTRVLHHLGLEEALRRQAFLPEGTQFRHWRTGSVISESPLGEAAVARFGVPYYHIHRGDLMSILAAAAEADPAIRLITGERIERVAQEGSRVVAESDGGRLEADLLVGADGIRSRVRNILWGEEKARFTGNVAWRALVPAERLPPGLIRPMSTAWWGPGRHFVHYFVRRGELINCVCVVEKAGWEVESWTEPGDHAELSADFRGWHETVRQLIENMDAGSLYKWALHDRAPMPRWSSGRMTLLGDACHPTLPFMAQGAAMAIEDAAVLADCVAGGGDEQALKRYERLRLQRTARIQNGSRRNATLFHLSGVKAWLRNRAVRRAGERTMDGLYGYNVFDAVKEEKGT